MAVNILRFVLVVLFALLTGAMFGIWVGYNPASLSASAFVEQHQNAVRSLNTLFPVMGMASALLAIVLGVLSKNDSRARYLFVAAGVLMVVAGVVTRFGNQPINATVMTWSVQAPADNWVQLRDAWWHYHIVRTIAAITALALIAFAVVNPKRAVKAAA